MQFESTAAVKEYAESTGRHYVKLGLSHSGSDLGSMLIELMTDVCPKTCAHFLQGVAGQFPGSYSYIKSPIHRVVKHAFIQGGDVVDGTGKGAPGFVLPDETFQLKHDDVGWVGMANDEEPHTASTQFYITLQPLKWLDGKRVVFGKVVDQKGLDLLRRVEQLPTNNERPLPEVIISSIEQVV